MCNMCWESVDSCPRSSNQSWHSFTETQCYAVGEVAALLQCYAGSEVAALFYLGRSHSRAAFAACIFLILLVGRA